MDQLITYVKEHNELPSNIDINLLPSEIICSLIEINPDLFDDIKLSNITSDMWGKIILLKPDEYLEIVPNEILINLIDKDKLLINNPDFLKYLSDEQIDGLKKANPYSISANITAMNEKSIEVLLKILRNKMSVYELNRRKLDAAIDYIPEKLKKEYYKVTIEFFSRMYYYNFNSIPEKYWSVELIDFTLDMIKKYNRNIRDLMLIFGENIINSRYITHIVEKDNRYLKYLPFDLIEEEAKDNAERLIQDQPYNIVYIPENETNRNMWIYALKKEDKAHRFEEIFEKMPKEYIDDEILNLVLNCIEKAHFYNKPRIENILPVIPDELIDKNFITKLIDKRLYKNIDLLNEKSISFLDKNLFDLFIYVKCLNYSIFKKGNQLGFVNEKNARKIIELVPRSVFEIDSKLVDKNLIIKTIAGYNLINIIPDRYANSTFLLEILKQNPKLFVDILNSKFKYLINSEMVDEYIKSDTVDLSIIPAELLTDDVIRRTLSHNPKALLNTIPAKRTNQMFMVAASMGIKDRMMPDDLKWAIDHNKIIDRKITNLSMYSEKIKHYAPYIKKYLQGSGTSIKGFCKNNNLNLSDFNDVMKYIEQNAPELYTEFKNMNSIHSSEGWNYVQRNVEFIKDGLFDGVDSLEKDEKIPFNIVTYYLYTAADPDVMYDNLKKLTTPSIYREFKKRIIYKNKADIYQIKNFAKGKYSFGDRIITEDEKKKIMLFADRNGIPKNYKTLETILSLYVNGDIDIQKKYDKKYSYEIHEERREKISEKVSKVYSQEKLLSILDEEIEKLRSQKVSYGGLNGGSK